MKILIPMLLAMAACATQKDFTRQECTEERQQWMKADDDLLQKVRDDDVKLLIQAVSLTNLCVAKLNECKASCGNNPDLQLFIIPHSPPTSL